MAARRIVPLLDRVLVRRVLPVEKTAGGVFLPESAQKKVKEGVVLAVGPGGRSSSGETIPNSVSVGDRIVLAEFGGGERIEMDNQELLILRNEDILAKIEEK